MQRKNKRHAIIAMQNKYLDVENIFNAEVLQVMGQFVTPATILNLGRTCRHLHASMSNMDVGKVAYIVHGYVPK